MSLIVIQDKWLLVKQSFDQISAHNPRQTVGPFTWIAATHIVNGYGLVGQLRLYTLPFIGITSKALESPWLTRSSEVI
ncbi:hypothetical protein MJO28_016374 [Puccinia striiformis f. sp. tritici]|uniref:Uncharacterized protein n=1 Tax=Puccinia striiformis f. sp. tritici TaxID=168172 RepID=A0ACC0DQG8_9BASI|nr:hypothetical protein MJO28_016374 [Puccinia striiformis f. sp. tritici]